MLLLGYPGNVPFNDPGYATTPKMPSNPNYNYNQPSYPNMPSVIPNTPSLGVLNQPVVQDMALQYGQQVIRVFNEFWTVSCVNLNIFYSWLVLEKV